MNALRGALLVSMVLLVGGTARADALGGPCPAGQRFQANPTQPGAMHHAGGQCVEDPSASHCGVAPGHARESTLTLAIGIAALVSGRVRRRVRVSGR